MRSIEVTPFGTVQLQSLVMVTRKDPSGKVLGVGQATAWAGAINPMIAADAKVVNVATPIAVNRRQLEEGPAMGGSFAGDQAWEEFREVSEVKSCQSGKTITDVIQIFCMCISLFDLGGE